MDGTNGLNTTPTYTLGASQRNVTVDVGIYREASLGDYYVWIDYMNVETGVMNNSVPGFLLIQVSMEYW